VFTQRAEALSTWRAMLVAAGLPVGSSSFKFGDFIFHRDQLIGGMRHSDLAAADR
jgi:hypothetical protein